MSRGVIFQGIRFSSGLFTFIRIVFRSLSSYSVLSSTSVSAMCWGMEGLHGTYSEHLNQFSFWDGKANAITWILLVVLRDSVWYERVAEGINKSSKRSISSALLGNKVKTGRPTHQQTGMWGHREKTLPKSLNPLSIFQDRRMNILAYGGAVRNQKLSSVDWIKGKLHEKNQGRKLRDKKVKSLLSNYDDWQTNRRLDEPTERRTNRGKNYISNK